MSNFDLVKSIGLHAHWGFSSTFDFIEASKDGLDRESNDPINILLVAPGDIRHIITTIGSRMKNEDFNGRNINFYITNSSTELMARDLLLLNILFDFEIPIKQRATLFLEVYGNLQVQKRTSDYLSQLSRVLRLSLSCQTETNMSQMIDLTYTTHRNRDDLDRAFHSIEESLGSDMNEIFDRRKRALYEDRFDNRKALYDWDYHYGIKGKASNIIHIKQFKHWRETGIGFEFGDQVYSETNYTLLSYAEGMMKKGKDRGIKKEVRGYWGDVVCSPYFSFGVDCDTPNKFAEDLFQIYNKDTGTEQYRHHTVEVALYNLFSLLYEIENGRQYLMTREHDIYSGFGTTEETTVAESSLPSVVEVLDENEPESIATNSTLDLEGPLLDYLSKAEMISEHLHGVKIFPMIGTENEILNKPRMNALFDAVFIPSRMVQLLKEPWFGSLLKRPAENAGRSRTLLAIETAKNLVGLSKSSKDKFSANIHTLAQSHNLERLTEAPVRRRKRDEKDLEEDVFFYVTK